MSESPVETIFFYRWKFKPETVEKIRQLYFFRQEPNLRLSDAGTML